MKKKPFIFPYVGVAVYAVGSYDVGDNVVCNDNTYNNADVDNNPHHIAYIANTKIDTYTTQNQSRYKLYRYVLFS